MGADGHTVAGDLRVRRGVPSPQLGGAARDLLAWLPPGHATGRRFPVVVMHDAWNLFDVATSTGDEWCVDGTRLLDQRPHGVDEEVEVRLRSLPRVLEPALVAGMGDPDHDRLDPVRRELLHCLVDSPLAAVRRGDVEQVLAVVHVDDRTLAATAV